ncbi:hypothetical protein BFP72_05395 [Reichenbachiella sp. 5M10]|nr:hypothetical protein BFP72_05395 [Reichenbachiella sp. 5M10]
MQINIAQNIGGDAAVSTEDGNEIFGLIKKDFDAGQVVILDFSGIEILTTAFLNAALGQLYSAYSSEQLNARLKLVNVADQDKILFKKVVARAKEYFANKKQFDQSANQAIHGS